MNLQDAVVEYVSLNEEFVSLQKRIADLQSAVSQAKSRVYRAACDEIEEDTDTKVISLSSGRVAEVKLIASGCKSFSISDVSITIR